MKENGVERKLYSTGTELTAPHQLNIHNQYLAQAPKS